MAIWKRTKRDCRKTAAKSTRKSAFTLPEVIVSFSILAMVITSAVGLLTVVIRTNSDNVNSLVANGLAQEGIEAVRFMRDSNRVLGLDFDGTKGNRLPVWGEKLFDKAMADVGYFTLVSEFEPETTCNTENLSGCLPVALQTLNGVTDSNLAQLIESDLGRVYLSKGEGADFKYYQLVTDESVGENVRPTQYSRVIRIEPLKSKAADFDVLRVSSIVTWIDNNGQSKQLVLTTDLTDWK